MRWAEVAASGTPTLVIVREVDGVVAGLGIQPNMELARAAGLKVDNGISVDEFLRTSQPDIYAAGDVAVRGRKIDVTVEGKAFTVRVDQAELTSSRIGRPVILHL